MTDQSRRNMLTKGSAVLAVGVLGGLGLKANADMAHSEGNKGIAAVIISADKEGICATCRFWGGIRRASEDKMNVYCESLGWCNNPDSPNYQKMTMPVPTNGPMKVWRKGEAL